MMFSELQNDRPAVRYSDADPDEFFLFETSESGRMSVFKYCWDGTKYSKKDMQRLNFPSDNWQITNKDIELYQAHKYANRFRPNGNCTIENDKKKPEMALVPFDFIAAMADNFERGLKDGRKAFDWKKIEWNDAETLKYFSKLMRHLMSAAEGKTDCDHLAAVACNAAILWHHERKLNAKK
jgi:hypothetical protein